MTGAPGYESARLEFGGHGIRGTQYLIDTGIRGTQYLIDTEISIASPEPPSPEPHRLFLIERNIPNADRDIACLAIDKG
jgi:hypothetical protein